MQLVGAVSVAGLATGALLFQVYQNRTATLEREAEVRMVQDYQRMRADLVALGYTEREADWKMNELGVPRPDDRVLARQALYAA